MAYDSGKCTALNTGSLSRGCNLLGGITNPCALMQVSRLYMLPSVLALLRDRYNSYILNSNALDLHTDLQPAGFS